MLEDEEKPAAVLEASRVEDFSSAGLGEDRDERRPFSSSYLDLHSSHDFPNTFSETRFQFFCRFSTASNSKAS